ncbi:MAG TPA: nuclear transport factor 2 family protein [Ilumatobacteraceae bacterium]
MADLAAIQQLLSRYCFAHDSQDPEMLATTFAKNATLLGITGRDEIAARYAEGYKNLTARRRHVLTNFLILEDGDERAVVQSYITLYLIRGDELELHLIGVYRDEVIVEDGEWKILTREATMDTPYNPGDNKPAAAGTYTQK